MNHSIYLTGVKQVSNMHLTTIVAIIILATLKCSFIVRT